MGFRQQFLGQFMGQTVQRVFGLVLPIVCPVCERPADGLCLRCETTFFPSPDVGTEFLAVFAYQGGAKQIVLASKGRQRHALTRWMADAIVAQLSVSDLQRGTLVTWPPTTRQRRRQRGFDHGELLARAVAKRLGVPCVGTLDRLTGAQVGQGRDDRQRVQFRVRRSAWPHLDRALRIVIVDDVRTTGATLRGARLALAGFERPMSLVTFAAVAGR